MSCYYRDGNNCGFCAKYGYPNISDAESYTCQSCSDDGYYDCPVANVFMQGEIDLMEEEEAEAERLEQERLEAERKLEQQEYERQQREEERRRQEYDREHEAYVQELEREEWRDRQESEGDDIGAFSLLGYSGMKSNKNRERISLNWKPKKISDLMVDTYGFSVFFTDMYTGSILTTLPLYFLLLAFLALSGFATYCVFSSWLLPMVSGHLFLRGLLLSSAWSGTIVMVVAMFRAFQWGALVFPGIISVTGLLLGIEHINGAVRAVISVLANAASTVVLIAGLLPGLLFMLLNSLIPDTLFPYANYILPGIAAFAIALPIGAYVGKKLCFFHNYLTRLRYRRYR